MRIPGFRFLLLVAALLLTSGPLSAQERMLGVERARIRAVLDDAYNLAPDVEDEVAALRRDHPASPVADLIEVGRRYWLQNYAGWDAAATARYEEFAETALDRAKAYRLDHPDDPDAAYAVALIELTQVMHAVDQRRWWAAFWKSRATLRTMEELLDAHPDYADAKLPLGMRHCYMANTPGYLKPLVFLMRFKGDMDLGLRLMGEARDGLYAAADAGYFLAGIRIELFEDREGAREIFTELVEAYPGNPLFVTKLAELERRAGDTAAALVRAQETLARPELAQFPELMDDSFATALWSAMGESEFDLALRIADRYEAFAEPDPELAGRLPWITHGRAEALQGLGRWAEAEALWESIPPGDRRLHELVEQRLEAIRAVLAEQELAAARLSIGGRRPR